MAYFICEKQGRCCPHEFYNSIEQAISDSEDGVPCDHLIEVDHVRHGRWLTWEEQFPGSTPKKQSGLGVFCDKCHSHADNRTDYCPNCGAKMDEEVSE